MALAKKAMTGGGVKLYLSSTLPTTWDKTGFEAIASSFKILGNTVNLGDWGKTWNETTFEPTAFPEAQVLKTNFNMGNPTVTYAYPAEPAYDEGQALMDEAVDSNDYYAVKLELQNGTVIYSKALVASTSITVGGVGDITMVSANLRVYTEGLGYVTVPPTP